MKKIIPQPAQKNPRGKKATAHVPAHQIAERWFVADAENAAPGRLATVVARMLMGKDQANFNPAVDAKTNVIVVNAEKIKFTGQKMVDKEYHHHTGYMGGLKTTTPARLFGKGQETRVLEQTITGMLPKNKLSTITKRRLYIYTGPTHPHGGQNPVQLPITK